MPVAKAKGRLRGKQPKLNPRQETHLVLLLKSGEYSTAEIGDLSASHGRPSTSRSDETRQGNEPNDQAPAPSAEPATFGCIGPTGNRRDPESPSGTPCPAGLPLLRDTANTAADSPIVSVTGSLYGTGQVNHMIT